MAGSGKTTMMQRLNAETRMRGKAPYLVNLDPAVMHLPYEPNIDIRDTVDYKTVMAEYGLGPNGAIMTSLNLFSTKFEQVMQLLQKRAGDVDYIFVDTPGQIEVFTWSASGQIITEMLAGTFPTSLLYVTDTPRCRNPNTFMSNMMYACSILYKTQLPFAVAFNKTDVVAYGFAEEWMRDFEAFGDALEAETGDVAYINSVNRSLSLVLDRFYSDLRAAGMSAATGEGVSEVFAALDDCRVEYEREYLPEMAAARELQRRRLEEDKAENMRRLAADAGSTDTGVGTTPHELLAAAREMGGGSVGELGVSGAAAVAGGTRVSLGVSEGEDEGHSYGVDGPEVVPAAKFGVGTIDDTATPSAT
jgi:hypothetical protein